MTEVALIPLILTSMTTAVLAVGGMYTFVLSREKAVWREIGKLADEIKDIRINYLNKFAVVNKNIADTSASLSSQINVMERNLRESNHTLAENVSKSLNRIELQINRQHPE